MGSDTGFFRGVTESTDRSAKLCRIDAEDGFGERLRAWMDRAGVKATDLARCLAIPRKTLYDVFDGERTFKAAWVELLPPAMLDLYLAELAGVRGKGLVEAAPAQVDDDGAQLADLLERANDLTTNAARAQADGFLSVDECSAQLKRIDAIRKELDESEARYREALKARGDVVRLRRAVR